MNQTLHRANGYLDLVLERADLPSEVREHLTEARSSNGECNQALRSMRGAVRTAWEGPEWIKTIEPYLREHYGLSEV